VVVRPRRPRSGAPGRVRGAVHERAAARPAAGLDVQLVSADSEYAVETLHARTDSSGRYEFAEVEPGAWTLGPARDRLPRTYAAVGADPRLAVARGSVVEAPALEVARAGCVAGHVAWSDGYVFSDGALAITPRDTALGMARGKVNGVGDYEICSAAADTAMVWLELHDGRRLGRPTRIDPDRPAAVSFLPDPLEQMAGAVMRIEARMPDGTPVRRAQVVVVGRQLGPPGEPCTVFAHEAVTDAAGGADLRLPQGTYEILVMNPRQGEYGRQEGFVLAPGAPAEVSHEVVLRGTSSTDERQRWRRELLERAERFQRDWGL
jgi:hypothetical protein